MNSSKTLLIILAVIILGVGIWFGVNQPESSIGEMISGEEGAASESMTEKEGEVMVSKVGSYAEYSAEKVAMAESSNVVIFFHASWCPSCRALNNNIEKNLDEIPSDLIILKADYDKEIELGNKYGVNSQHTLVQVDQNGNMIQKWSGGSRLSSIVSRVQ